MIVIMRDAVMPDCCNTCVCSEWYGCGITGTVMTTKEMEERPDWCPLEEQEPCEDTISRQAAVDAIYHHLPSVSRTRARTMLHEVPSAQPEPRWIPCSERLPAYGEDVLLSIGEYCNVGYHVAVNDETDGEWYYSGWYHPMNDVSAWMPLPEPYNAERREE